MKPVFLLFIFYFRDLEAIAPNIILIIADDLVSLFLKSVSQK